MRVSSVGWDDESVLDVWKTQQRRSIRLCSDRGPAGVIPAASMCCPESWPAQRCDSGKMEMRSNHWIRLDQDNFAALRRNRVRAYSWCHSMPQVRQDSTILPTLQEKAAQAVEGTHGRQIRSRDQLIPAMGPGEAKISITTCGWLTLMGSAGCCTGAMSEGAAMGTRTPCEAAGYVSSTCSDVTLSLI